MPTLKGRRLLCTLGATASGGVIAGCLDDLPGATGGDADDRLRDGAVVDYPGMVDGEASVSADERTIEYQDPEATFELGAGYRGEEADGSQLRISRDLSGETMAAFVAPAYVEANERFEYHVFANDAFVEFDEWHVVGFSGKSLEDVVGTSFDHIQGPVHGFVVTPEDVDGVAVVDETADNVSASDQDDLTGVAINRTSRDRRPTAPSVAFAFYYDADAERLEVVHEGGDSVPAVRLSFVSVGDVTVMEGFEGTVGAGDAATFSVPPTAEVEVVWTSEDGAEITVLGAWTGPDA